MSKSALRALAERSCEESTIALAGLLDLTEHSDMVRLALSAPSAGRIAGIFRALETADDETAAMLTSALTRMRTKESTDTLLLVLQSGNVAARKAATAALGATGPSGPTLDALRRTAANDPDLEVRAIAALASSRG